MTVVALEKYEAQYNQICRLMFNHNDNYAHWLAIHYTMTLKEKHLLLAWKFRRGHFVIHKSSWQCLPSPWASQCYHQGRWGVVGVTEDASPLRLMIHVVGLKFSHLIAKQDTKCRAKVGTEQISNRKETERAQKYFIVRWKCKKAIKSHDRTG